MSKFSRRLVGGGALAMAVLAGTLAVSTAGDALVHTKYRGEFGGVFPSGAYDEEIAGLALMKVGTASTKVKVELEGLDPTLVYTSHLHDGNCASGGGGHYQNVVNPSNPGDPTLINPVNELWLSNFEVGFGITATEGVAVTEASGRTDWAARTTDEIASNAKSVVLHAPGGARIACADLTLD